jgi:hypothetical protein
MGWESEESPQPTKSHLARRSYVETVIEIAIAGRNAAHFEPTVTTILAASWYGDAQLESDTWPCC